jgi:structural maintenance of chromosome 2
MPYVFGSTIICDNSQVANKITYSAQLRSVTVDGDVYETGGTLSGGAAPSSSGTLLKVQQLARIQSQLSSAHSALRGAEDAIKRHETVRTQWKTLGQQMEMKSHELAVLEQQLDGSGASRVRFHSP